MRSTNIGKRGLPAGAFKTTRKGSRRQMAVLLTLLQLAFWVTAVPAQKLPQDTARALPVRSLDSILASIRNNHPVLESYDYKIKAMNAYAEGAGSWSAPMIGAGTFMTPYPGQGSAGEGDKGMLMLAATQAIPNPAKLRAKENYLESKAAIQAAGQGETYNQLRAQAKSLYYEWAVLEKKKKVLAESRQIMELLLKLARIRYPYNQASLGSIYKAEGRLYEVANKLLEINSSIDEKNIALNALMNIPYDTRYRIDTNIQDLAAEPDFTGPEGQASEPDTAYLMRHRSDLIGMERLIESMQLEVELERMERKPEFSLRFEHMLPYGGMMPNTYTLMGMISIPIAPWSSKKYKSTIKGMQLEVKSLEKTRQSRLNQVQGIISGLSRNMRRLWKQLENYDEKILPALRKNYEATLLSYEQNQEELPMVIDAWEALNLAQMEHLNTLEAYYLKVVEYEKQVEK